MSQKKEAAYDLNKESFEVKVNFAKMLCGGVIVDVSSVKQAKIAQEAGAVAVMVTVLEHEKDLKVFRMPDPELIIKIQEEVSIPVMAKCRVGHFVEAQVLEALFVDFIDESEALTKADSQHFIKKHAFRIPFVCGSADLGEALRRIGEGASLIRTKGTFKKGNIVEAVANMRSIQRDIRRLSSMDSTELMAESKTFGAPYRLVQEVAESGQLQVPIFASGGITTPADAAMLMQLGAEGIFVGAEIFEMDDPLRQVKAIIAATSCFEDPEMLASISRGMLTGVPGINSREPKKEELMIERGL